MTPLRWLRAHEPLWLVTGAGAAVDVLTQVLPVVPDSWHPAVDVVVAVLTVAAGRQLVWSPASVRRVVAPSAPPHEPEDPPPLTPST